MPRPDKTEFYSRPVVEVAKDLIGCSLICNGVGGKIVETEAYHDSEEACHAFIGKTPRTEPLFEKGGMIYVYFSYGIHYLVNIVCEGQGVGAAVLIRALEPNTGIDIMKERRGTDNIYNLCSGPAKLTLALEIDLSINKTNVFDGPIRVGPRIERAEIISSTRIGISKATDLPWRFTLEGSPFISKPLKTSPLR